MTDQVRTLYWYSPVLSVFVENWLDSYPTMKYQPIKKSIASLSRFLPEVTLEVH